MKVGILTFHAAHNFGSMLQAYALQKTVIGLGNVCKIINLRSESQMELYDYKSVVRSEHNVIKKLLKMILFRNRKKQYEKFEKFDVYISGSDQIWNTGTQDFDDSYILSFNREGKRIAYAVSAGSGSCNLEKYKKQIECYDAIGVREFALQDYLYNNLAIQSSVTLDPTLLLDQTEWDEIRNREFEKKLPEKYILFYSLGYGEEEICILNYLTKYYKMPIITPHRLYTGEAFRRNFFVLDSCGPEEFVSLICKASHVFTTSFHGCAFSVIFKKDFIAYLPNEGHIDERKKSLLQLIGEPERGVTSLKDVVAYCETYGQGITERIKLIEAIRNSKDFLARALKNEKRCSNE